MRDREGRPKNPAQPDAGAAAATPAELTRMRVALQRRAATRSQLQAGKRKQALDSAQAEPGDPLDGASRERFEPALGADLSSVRVHGGAQAGAAADALGARAFTVGADVYLGQGEAGDQKLMAHELTHAVQNAKAGSAGGVARRALDDAAAVPVDEAVSRPDDPAELEAESVAQQAVAGKRGLSIKARPGGALHREKKPGGPTDGGVAQPGGVAEGEPAQAPGTLPQTEEESNAATAKVVSTEVEVVVQRVYDVLEAVRARGAQQQPGEKEPDSVDELADSPGTLSAALNVANFTGGMLELKPIWGELDEPARRRAPARGQRCVGGGAGSGGGALDRDSGFSFARSKITDAS